MTVDHILFNNQSWYSVAGSADNATINGKKYYAVPKKITIKQGTYLSYPSNMAMTYAQGMLHEDYEVDCVGANDDHYFFVGYPGSNDTGYTDSVHYTFSEGEGCGVGEVLKSDCSSVEW